MSAPFLSVLDPKSEDEGTLDPLGLGIAAERLAESILPGLTARMRKPRYLTAMTVAAAALEDLEVEESRGVPPFIAFEWLYVLSMATLTDEDALTGVPGMRKAQAALREKKGLTPSTYLKSPTVFGFHGVYKTLATHMELIDEEMGLEAAGDALNGAWEQVHGLSGFHGPVFGRQRRGYPERIRRAVSEALSQREGRLPTQALRDFFIEHLHPDEMTKAEARCIRRLIEDERGGTRGEVFSLLSRMEIEGGESELALFEAMERRASEDLAPKLEAIRLYERAVWPLHQTLEWARHLSTKERYRPLTPAEMAAGMPDYATGLEEHIERAEEALGVEPFALPPFRDVVASVRHAKTQEALVEAVLLHHKQNQRRKPPAGKRTWFEDAREGRYAVRLLFRLDEPPPTDIAFVHQYRTRAVFSFLHDLRIGGR